MRLDQLVELVKVGGFAARSRVAPAVGKNPSRIVGLAKDPLPLWDSTIEMQQWTAVETRLSFDARYTVHAILNEMEADSLRGTLIELRPLLSDGKNGEIVRPTFRRGLTARWKQLYMQATEAIKLAYPFTRPCDTQPVRHVKVDIAHLRMQFQGMLAGSWNRTIPYRAHRTTPAWRLYFNVTGGEGRKRLVVTIPASMTRGLKKTDAARGYIKMTLNAQGRCEASSAVVLGDESPTFEPWTGTMPDAHPQ